MNVKKKKYDIVSKGTCDYPQTENFVAAKQFLIITENDRRYLLVKLVNNRTENVTGATLLVEQFNDRGEKIASESVHVDGFNGYPKKSFAVETKIPVAPTCIDCRITVTDAEFGKYVYNADDAEQPKYKLESDSDNIEPEVPANILKKAGKKGVAVSPRSLKMPMLVLIISLALLATAFVVIWIYTSRFVSNEDRFLHDGVYYAFENNDRSDGSDIYVTGVRGAKSEISVPASIQGHKVVRVGDGAFSGNDNLKKVILSGDIKIGDRAFFGCIRLESITFKNVTAIDSYAFAGCAKLKSVVLENANYIGENAFNSCVALSSVKISGDGDALIMGDGAFGNCVALRSVEIDRELDYSAMSATSAIFDSSLGVSSLYLKNFKCNNGARSIVSLFNGSPALSTLVIDSIDAIGPALCDSLPITTARFNAIETPVVCDRAFADCKNLAEVIMPTQVTSVGYEAFLGTAIKSFDASALEVLHDKAFCECKNLTSVALENNTKLTEIGAAAFKGCTELKAMDIPSHVTWLGAEIFSGCENLESVKFAEDSEIRTISQSAFENCIKLASISLPSGVTTLGAKTFAGCTALTAIELPQNLSTIGAEVFADTGLTTITVPDSVLSIARGAFSGCAGLKEITVPFVGGSRTSNQNLSYIFGATSATDGSKVPTSLKSVTVSDSTIAANNAFNGCAGITSIVYNNGLSLVGNNAFNGCSSLTAIELDSNISSIGNNAFSGCSSLTEITLPNSLMSIGRNAFGGCTKLATLTTPFVGGSRDDNAYLSYMFGGEVSEVDKIPSSLTKVEITDTETIGSSAFLGTSVKEVILGDATKSISADAFKNNRKLNVITLSRGLERIGDNAFYGCYFLYEVFNLSEALKDRIIAGDQSYGYVAYYALKVHGIDESRLNVASYYGYDFVENDSMWHLVRYPEEQAELTLPSGENGVIISGNYSFESYELRGRLFRDNDVITSVHIPSNVISIGEEAFYGCEKLETVTVAEGVNDIRKSAFEGCKALSAFKFPSGVTTVAERLFYGCELLETVTLPEKADDISDEQFSIGAEAFSGCKALKEITVPIGCTEIGDSAFCGCESIVTANLSTCTAIGDSAFEGCESLTAVAMSEKCATIGDSAFSGCVMLNEVAIPASCQRIGDSAFYGCKRIKTVTLPESLTEIGDDAFYGCTKLYEVYNLTDWEIPYRSESYGYVAANAYAVHTDAEDKALDNIITDDGLHYYKLDKLWYVEDMFDEQWYLVDYYGEGGEIEVCAFTYDGTQVDDIYVMANAFQGYDFITSLSFAEQVKQIETGAFGGCKALASVSISASSITVCDGAFSGCEGLTALYVTCSDNITFGTGAFKDCALQSATLVGGVVEVDSYVFSGNADLKLTVDCQDFVLISEFVFGDSFAEADINCANAFVAADYAFKGAVIDKLTVNAKSVTIGEANFNNDISEMNITGTTSVNISSYAFNDSNLNSLSIEGGNVTVNQQSFVGCTVVDSLSIVGDQITMDSNAVYTCKIGEFSLSGDAALGDLYDDSAVFNTTEIVKLAIDSDDIYLKNNMFFGCTIEALSLTGAVEFADSGTVFTSSTIIELNVTSDEDIVMPQLYDYSSSISKLTVKGKTVTVNENAFSGWYTVGNLTVVDITADDKLKIADRAFFGQMNLRSVTLTADKSAEIGEYAFAVESGSQLASITLPTGLKEIKKHTFDSCNALTALTIPQCVTSIGEFAFSYCQLLATLELPDGLKTINKYAFVGCSSLEKLTVPNSVTSIGEGAFNGCSALEILTLSKGIDKISDYIFSGCNKLAELTIPDSVKSIGEYAFSDCNALNALEIPGSVKSIGEYAFGGCGALTTLKISDSVTSIGSRAFNCCGALTQLEIPDSVTSIDYSAFGGCSSLKTLKLSKKLTTIASDTFSWCNSLTDLEIPSSVTSIDSCAFIDCYALKTLYIPNSVTSIGTSAFGNCGALTQLNIPNSVTSMGDNAFSGCGNLAKLTLSNNLDFIADSAFSGCNSLTELIVPSAVTSIGYAAFSGCTALTKLQITSANITISDRAFYGCEALPNIDIGNISFISDSAFEGCNAARSIKLSFKYYYSDHFIGNNAFSGCAAVESISITANQNVSIYSGAFNGCVALTKLELGKVDFIDGYAFYGCEALTSIDIANISYIGDNAFGNCKAVKNITLDFKYNYYSYNGNCIGNGAFSGCKAAENITITADQKISIYSEAFSGCSALIKLELDNVGFIGDRAFYGCSSLTELDLGNVGYIGSYAFSGCSKLKYIELPSSLYSIDAFAFENAKSLFAVYNRSDLDISSGWDEYSYGGVAKYAAVVTKNKSEAQLTYVESGKNKLVRSGTGTWYLYETDGVTLPESVNVTGYGKIDKYVIKCYTFKDKVDEIVIPTSVVGIQNTAFGGGIINVYYKGTATQWGNMSENYLARYNVYYYVDCVHDMFEWTYKDGNVSTDIQPLTEWQTVTQPTCTSKGKEERHCEVCGKRKEERDIAIDEGAHDYDGGKCKYCGKADPNYDADENNGTSVNTTKQTDGEQSTNG